MTRRPVRAALGVAVAASGMALAIASPAFAADGDIDPTYGDPTGIPGTVSTTFSSSAVPQALAMQFDSKIVVTGGVGTSFGTARYYNDGDLDGNWGAGNGRVTTAVGATGSPSGAFAVAIQPLDDKVVVAGYAGNPGNGANRDFAVVRYTPSGALDTTFDTDGTTTVDFRPEDTATGIALQADGKIVVAGTATDPNSPSSGNSVMAVIRLNADGTLDSSFDADGKVTVGTGGNGVSGEGVVVQADGKIVVVGTSNGATIALARLNPNGTQDSTFDADGIALTDISTVIGLPGALAQASGLALDNDGRIVVSGRQSLSSGEAQTLAARYNPDGTLDGSFGIGGIALADLALANEGANDVALQNDGKVVVTGFAGNDVSVVRFTSTGGLDGSFDTDGFVIRPVGIGDDVGNDVVVQADGKVLVAASGTVQTNEGGNAAFNTVRFLGSSPGIRPPAPPNVVATPGDTWAHVCWEPPPTIGPTILAYTISQFPGGAFQTVPGTQRCVSFTGLTNGVAYTFSVSARTQLAAGPPGTSTTTPNANAAPLGAASFVPLPPTRVLDTRDGTGAAAGKVPRDGSLELTVRGRGGVPDETTVTAVVLNVTATESGGAGFVTAYPTGEPSRPNVSNLNVSGANQTIPNLVTVKLGAGGRVTLYAFDTTHLIADVVGYYVSSTGATSGRFNPLAPARILDTRDGNGVPSPGTVPPGGEVQLQVTGRGGVPAGGVSAVIMNVTSTEASAPGYITVYPSGVPRPYGSNLNAETTNQTRPNLVAVPVGADGKVTLFSQSGTHLIADVAGWFTDGSAAQAVSGLFVPTVPTRILDTRDGTGRPGRAKVAPDASIDVQVSGLGGVSATRSAAVVANLTATEATNPGFVTAYPTGIARPTVSNVNVEVRNQTIPNAVTVRLGTGGKVTLYTQSGTHLAFDTFGWYVG